MKKSDLAGMQDLCWSLSLIRSIRNQTDLLVFRLAIDAGRGGSSDRASSAGTNTRHETYIAICNLVAETLADQRLSSSTVAQHFGITPRYVQMLFAEKGITFKSFVTDMRLEQVKRDLIDNTKGAMSVAEIAFGWGLSNRATFHRNFRRKFGEAPDKLRRRCRRDWPALR